MALTKNSTAQRSPDPAPGIALVPLSIAVVITLALTIYPLLLVDAAGRADHLAAVLALWAMSAGFVRGVGFIPKHRAPRLLLSTSACLVSLALSVAALARHWPAP